MPNFARMNTQLFLGGACGTTTWRQEIAIPLLERAGISFFNPQLAEGSWTPEAQLAEQRAKNECETWLFVLNGQTRGVASLVEIAWRIGKGGKLALAVEDIPADAVFDGQKLQPGELKDLNRGRAYLRELAAMAQIPVFEDVAAATAFAIELAKKD